MPTRVVGLSRQLCQAEFHGSYEPPLKVLSQSQHFPTQSVWFSDDVWTVGPTTFSLRYWVTQADASKLGYAFVIISVINT